MSTDARVIERIVSEARQLEPQERVLLIHRLLETLALPAPAGTGGGILRFGEFSGEGMSSEEDFAVAEWQPSEHELDGR